MKKRKEYGFNLSWRWIFSFALVLVVSWTLDGFDNEAWDIRFVLAAVITIIFCGRIAVWEDSK